MVSLHFSLSKSSSVLGGSMSQECTRTGFSLAVILLGVGLFGFCIRFPLFILSCLLLFCSLFFPCVPVTLIFRSLFCCCGAVVNECLGMFKERYCRRQPHNFLLLCSSVPPDSVISSRSKLMMFSSYLYSPPLGPHFALVTQGTVRCL